MAKSVSVTLGMVDRISQKLDAIAKNADRALNKVSDLCSRMDEAFGRATSTADRMSESMQAAASAASGYTEHGNRAADILEQQAESADSAAQALEGHASSADTLAQALDEQAESANTAIQALEEQEEAADSVAQALEGQADAVDNAVQALEEQAEAAESAAQALQEQAETIDISVQAMEEQAGTIDEVTEALEEQEEVAESVADALGGLDDSLGGLGDGLGGFGDGLGGLDDDLDGLGDGLDDTTRSVMDFGDALVAAGIAVALNKIKDAYFDCDDAADKFESAMAKVGTIADTEALSLDSIQQQIQALSKDTGVAVSDLAESTYSAISASVDTADAVAFVSQANSLAVGGFTQTSTAVDILTTALNAYGLEASETSNIADMLIQTQNLGKTSVDELGSSMGKIIPTANSLGVQLDVLCGSYAVMTANGIATAETTTYMNSMLNELGKNGSTAANALKEGTEHIREGGLTMAEAMESGMSLTDVLSVLDEQARESGTSISNMFGSAEAGKAANVLWGNAQKVDRAINQMNNSAGAAQIAFEKMSNTSEFIDQKWQNALENLKISIGNAQPSLDGLMEKGTEIVNMLSDFVDDHPAVVSAFEGMALAMGIFTVAMGAYSAAALIGEKATLALTAAMDTNPIFLLVTALAAVAIGVAAFVSSLGEAEEAQEKLTGSSLKLSNEIERQKQVVESLKEEYGTNNEKTLEAQARLNELQAEYDETKKTVEDFESQIRQTIDAVDESIAAYDKASGELEDQSFYAMSLVTELEKLQSQSALTAFQLQYEKQVVAELNAIYPELGLSYDEVTRKLGNSTEYLKKYCEQKNEQRRLELDSQQYAEYLEKQAMLKRDLTEADRNLKDAQAERASALEVLEGLMNDVNPDPEKWSEYETIFDNASIAIDKHQASVDELTAEMEVLQTAMGAVGAVSDLTAAAINGIDGASDNLIETTGDLRVAMEGVFTNVQEQAQELAEAYQDAYNSIASAVHSSFGMFEKIERKSKMTTESMIEAWKSQEEYLLEYASNIEKAKEYGIDASLVENLADGSQESAAALDTIIAKVESLGTSTDSAKGYIKEMNDTFTSVHEAELTLDNALFAANTTLNAKMEELKASMEAGVNGLNLSDAAAGAAQETIAAYIASIEEMKSGAVDAAAGLSAAVQSALAGARVGNYNAARQSTMYTGKGIVDEMQSSVHPAVEKAYRKMAKNAYDAVNDEWMIKSPSRKFKESARYTMEGVIEGVEESQTDVGEVYAGIAGMSVERYQEKIMEIGAVTDEYLGLVVEKYGRYSDETSKAMDFVVEKMNGLSEAYDSNYESAYNSISGQLGLFNDVKAGQSKSIDEMLESLDKQADYMAAYGAHMYQAMELGVDDGILEKLSDGSSESAAILKEIVTNGSNRIDELNASFAKVEEGKKTFSTVMAEMQTFYGSKLDDMVSDMKQAVSDMEQYGEAHRSAERTCQGIMDGVDSMWGEVVGKYAELSDAAMAAFAPVGNIPVLGGIPVKGNATGTTYGEDVYIAGENGPELIVGRRGSEVFPASETARILSAVMANRDSESQIGIAPQEIINTIVHENNSSSTENRNMTLTINGKGSLGVGQGMSRKEVMDYMRDELETAIMNIMFTEMYEEGNTAYEF